jgi:thymidylate synthase (FAD)
MIEIQPKVYLAASSMTEYFGSNINCLSEFLADINHKNWDSNSESESDTLLEIAGRLCYRSFSVYDENNKCGTNQNVTRIREDNKEYIQNIIKQHHGSVLEHSNVSLIFHNVSRVFTHELVRHRAGMAYSQESLRYVRLDELKFWIPEEVKENEKLYSIYKETVEYLENIQSKLNEIVNLDKMSFDEKKKWTSRFRRLAPIGLATSILVTGNIRAWRHIINMRGNKHAEEEIKLVMDQVVPILKKISPASFDDLEYSNNEWKYKLDPKP